MSIINDALKKTQKEFRPGPAESSSEGPVPSSPPDNQGERPQQPNMPVFLGLGLAVCALIVLFLVFSSKDTPSPTTSDRPVTRQSSPVRKAPAPESKTMPTTTSLQEAPRHLVLSGVIMDEATPLALINGQILETGDSIEGWEVTSISEEEVEVQGRSGTFLLRIGQ